MEVLKDNPFAVLTPDGLEVEVTDAKVIHKLFVNVFEDFRTIPQQGHVFINGPRGSGKSMMFRFMLPDCQLIDNNVLGYNKLKYFSIHIPIKLTSINNPEFELVKNSGDIIFNEHVLTIYFLDIIFDSFTKLDFSNIESKDNLTKEIAIFYNDVFKWRLKLCGWTSDYIFEPNSPEEAFKLLNRLCNELFLESLNFLKRNAQARNNASNNESLAYTGALCDYLTFLFPILKELKKISLFPSEKPFFLLVDDADNLTETQTIILNTWVSYRTNSDVSLKISTQLNYKTYNTFYGTNIDSPHDYYDVNIQTTYSSSKDTYNKRVRQIVERRLQNFYGTDKNISADEFFPQDKNQIAEIEKEKKLISASFQQDGRGFRESDDILRYAVPNYIRRLSGVSKNLNSYSYSGFDQLVSISSGIVRYFLTPAAKMFNTTYAKQRMQDAKAIPQDINYIPPSVQSETIKDYSTEQLFKEYKKLEKDLQKIKTDSTYLSKVEKLRNLIESLGTLFHEYLISDRSERRIFSFAISDKVNSDLQDVLDFGVEMGYFQTSSIGKKRGSGRTTLYILTRILSPYFKLDPNSFAGYKFFTAARLNLAIRNPDTFREHMKNLSEKAEESEDQQQLLDF
jgi:hypothetical protein